MKGSNKNRLKVMADFSSSGIWDGNTGVMIDYETLWLEDKNIINEFEKWIDYYDECFEKDFSTFKKDKSEKLNKWGRELAKKLNGKMINVGTGEREVVYQGEDESGMFESEII